MVEENENILDIQDSQNYLNELLENTPMETSSENDSDNDDDKLSVKDSELLKNTLNIEDVNEELDPKQVQKLLDFVGGDWKEKNPDDLEDKDLELLTKIAVIKAGHFNYKPKKHFGINYKKKRNMRNKMAKRSRSFNRR